MRVTPDRTPDICDGGNGSTTEPVSCAAVYCNEFRIQTVLQVLKVGCADLPESGCQDACQGPQNALTL